MQDDKPQPSTDPQDIRVRVEARWLQEHSAPKDQRWAFAYTVTIVNDGKDAATLLARHWIITDGNGEVEHVRGPGVVGYQPNLTEGQSFTYTSGAILKTSHGMMEGEYLMVRPDGTRFEAPIPAFALVTPDAIQ